MIDRYDGRHVHFIVSTIGRGGFRGGPVIHEYGFLLGVYTGMFQEDFQRTGGFPAVLSIEPLLNLMDENGIYPGENGRWLRDFDSIFDEPLENVLRAPDGTLSPNAEACVRADHKQRGRIAKKRAANPRYKPDESERREAQ